MQPTIPTARPLTPLPNRSRRRRPPAAVLVVGALALGSLLAACGGSSGSDADAAPDTTAPVDGGSATDDTSGDPAGGTDETTTAPAGAADLDLCAEVSGEEVAAILTGADLVDVSPREGIPTPSCRYQVEIGGGAATAPVVTIDWNEPGFFDAQRELQTSETDLPELDADAFILEEGSPMVYVRGETGDFLVTQGVELTDGGQPATREQLIAIAELVQDL